jgi:hypothetical protein
LLAFAGEDRRSLRWDLFHKHGLRSVVYMMEERSPDPEETRRLRRAGTAGFLSGGLVLAAIFAWLLGLP